MNHHTYYFIVNLFPSSNEKSCFMPINNNKTQKTHMHPHTYIHIQTYTSTHPYTHIHLYIDTSSI